jgi:hypothetical protein
VSYLPNDKYLAVDSVNILLAHAKLVNRSEERRVGKEC